MTRVLIRQIPDDYAESTGLAKYNRSRMPKCKDVFGVALNSDERFNTGFDEQAAGVKEADKESIKAIRESLEKRTGKKLDGLSDYWETYAIPIYSDKPLVFNTENAAEDVALRVLIANGNVAPDKEAASTPRYRDAQYYAYTEEGEVIEEVTVRKKRDTALVELLKISENREKMLLYGQYLEGLKYTSKLQEGTLYTMLRSYIEDKDIKNASNFINALKRSVEEIQQKILIDKALKQRLIQKSSIGGKKQVYQYGQVTVGSTLEEVYRNLSLPDFAPELMSIKSELENK